MKRDFQLRQQVLKTLDKCQENYDLGLGSVKITSDHNLTNQRQNISQNVSENFDSDLGTLEVLKEN